MAETILEATRHQLHPVRTLLCHSGLSILRPELDGMRLAFDESVTALGRGTVLVAEVDGVVAAASWARNRVHEVTGVDAPLWCWQALAVRHEYRGTGLGSRMAEATVEAARSAGAEWLYGQCAPEVLEFHHQVGMVSHRKGHSMLMLGDGVAGPLTGSPTDHFVYRQLVDEPSLQLMPVDGTRNQVQQAMARRSLTVQA